MAGLVPAIPFRSARPCRSERDRRDKPGDDGAIQLSRNRLSLSSGQVCFMRRITTVVVGAGHAGLAMSRCLGERGIDHVVIERGEIANSWRTERWDSLRLLTPNWQRRLPGFVYDGDDPDGFAGMSEVI